VEVFIMAKKKDYGLCDLEEDDLYNLLPYVVRATDPSGAIRTFFNALAVEHNYFKAKLRAAPRLIDPDKCGKFDPSKFGESSSDFLEYLELRYKSEAGILTEGGEGYLSQLTQRLPQSIKAREEELKYLGLLADTVGVQVFSRFVMNSVRNWVKTGMIRHKIKGGHSSVYVLGRVLGFIDLKVSELWSRCSIKDPSNPSALRNDGDFSYASESFPYRPLDGSYDGGSDLLRKYDRGDGEGGITYVEESIQVPQGSIDYNPNILDDGEVDYTVTFPYVDFDPMSRLHYNLVVNDHNPFGNFKELVTKNLVSGDYTLIRGSQNTKAYTTIPSTDGSTEYLFEAVTFGEWGNKITVTIANNNLTFREGLCDDRDVDEKEGRQRISITGPQSKIKYKSSYFDLVMTLDPSIFVSFYPALPVTRNQSILPIGGYTYTVTGGQMVLVIDGDVTAGLESGSVVYIDGSSSQVGLDGYTIDRNKKYVLALEPSYAEVGDETTITLDLAEGENCTYDLRANSGEGYADGEIPDGAYTGIEFNGQLYRIFFSELNVGEYPITGSLSGISGFSDPSVDYELNFAVYLEVVAILREMFEKIRPISRTPRKEFFGLLFRDTIPYAPTLVVNEVFLESVDGTLFRMSVRESGIVWEVSLSGTKTPVFQKDSFDGRYYEWVISNAGVMTLQPLSLISGRTLDIETLVYHNELQEGEISSFIYVEGGSLKSSITSPEVVVDRIHLIDGGEAALDESFGLVVENPNDIAALYMSEDATSPDEPADNFIFQTSPEDDLSSTFFFQDHIYGHVGAMICQDVKLEWTGDGRIIPVSPLLKNDFGFHEGLWGWKLDGSYVGQDPRWDSRGIETGLITPPPTPDATNKGWSNDYPVYMNHHNIFPWRDRVTNEPYYSSYTYESVDAVRGPEREDFSLAVYDGPIEPTGEVYGGGDVIPAVGGGMTPNNQVHPTEIDRPWKPYKSRLITPPDKNYTGLSDSSGDLRVEYPDDVNLSDVFIGMKIMFPNEPSYTGVYTVMEVGVGYIITSAIYFAASAALAEDRYINLLSLQLDVWELSGNEVTIHLSPYNNFTIGATYYEVYVNDVPSLSLSGTLVLTSGFVSQDGEINDTQDPETVTLPVAAPNDKRSIFTLIRGGDNAIPVLLKMSQSATEAKITSAGYGGDICAWGGARDSLEITILPYAWSGLSGLDIDSDSTVQHTDGFYIDGNGGIYWRGGVWEGEGIVTLVDTNRSGLPPILNRDNIAGTIGVYS
jgi:hypothetical protein